ncbi:MAG: type III pantothenate kinase [Gammaproteobacteria bacterium]
MILLIELGNSRLKWALLTMDEEGPGTIEYGTPEYYLDSDPETVFSELLSDIPQPESVVVASVAHDTIEEALSQWIDDNWCVPLDFIETEKTFDELINGYDNPAQLGVDRWLNLVAAWDEFGGPFCVIDCGTAVTVDVVNDEGQHLGGLIVPGVDMMSNALEAGTAGCILNSDECEEETNGLLAQNTTQGITGGSVYAMVAFIDRIMNDLTDELGDNLTCLITGGDAEAMQPLLQWESLHRPTLSLDGLILQFATLVENDAINMAIDEA